jgi:hypothetical protein
MILKHEAIKIKYFVGDSGRGYGPTRVLPTVDPHPGICMALFMVAEKGGFLVATLGITKELK